MNWWAGRATSTRMTNAQLADKASVDLTTTHVRQDARQNASEAGVNVWNTIRQGIDAGTKSWRDCWSCACLAKAYAANVYRWLFINKSGGRVLNSPNVNFDRL